MKQTLLVIPHELYGIPLFGYGWVLAIWLLWGIGFLIYLVRKQGWNRDTASYLPMMLIGAMAIVWLLPMLEASDVKGLAIRGYGAMFLIAVVSGVAITLRMARSAGLHPDVIYSMSFWCFVCGIIGARLFFVIQYWPHYFDPFQPGDILNFTEGGLVVYGSLIGAMLAYFFVMHYRQLPKLATIDLFVPGLAMGLAFGRIGCLLNGCCWGGVCEDSSLAIQFPRGAPAYMQQLERGELLGIELEDSKTDSNKIKTVSRVKPKSLAEQKGVAADDRVLMPIITPSAHQLRSEVPSKTPVTLLRDGSPKIKWEIDELPKKSLPVAPTQIFSSINATLICLLAWSWYPARRRDGELLAGMLTVYPITRFLLEMIRTDEPGRWGTGLTVAQWASILLLILAVFLWAYILCRPAKRCLPVQHA